MAIGSFFRALHTAPGDTARARFSQYMTIYVSTIFILSAGVGARTFIGDTFPSKPTFEHGVVEKMETLDVMQTKISTTATTISTTTTGISKTLADLLPTPQIPNEVIILDLSL
ncbi:hypothetical protein RHMOL_Rhmol02G0004700 [Rhododendron molle]|uniref:Uncharacterized protein n=1 Tax=Rhododendron molle TaxID=49168 RepID=A0ACC0PKE3_RHOML|nr:hypothetical protein RHMOL_Rhmol02G0004700 [Rhododendron molle]